MNRSAKLAMCVHTPSPYAAKKIAGYTSFRPESDVSVTAKTGRSSPIFQRDGASEGKCRRLFAPVASVAAVALIYTRPFRSLTGKKRRSGSNATDNNLSSRPLTASYVSPGQREFRGRAEISRIRVFLPARAFPRAVQDSRFHNCASALEERVSRSWRNCTPLDGERREEFA